MKIGIAKERRAHELRVAVSPDTVKKFVGLGAEVLIEALQLRRSRDGDDPRLFRQQPRERDLCGGRPVRAREARE